MKFAFRILFLLTLLAHSCFGQGSIDQVSCTTIRGWGYLPSANPSSSATVVLYSDGGAFETVTANLYRPDVQAVIGGNGLYGFNIVTPASLQNGQAHAITAVVQGGTALTSSGTPTSLYCTPGMPYYTYTEVANTSPGPNDPAHWSSNGTINSGYPGGSYIWNQTPSNWNSEYEVRTTLSLNTSGGIYQQYLRGQANALSGAGGDTFLIEVQNPNFSNGGCTATLAAYELSAGSASNLLSTTISCSQNMVVRTVVFGSTVQTMVSGQVYSMPTVLTSGSGGFGSWGVPSGNSVTSVEIGPRNTASPNPINPQTIFTSPFPNYVDIRWQEPVDTTGIGMAAYTISRSLHNANNYQWTFFAQPGALTDSTVAAGTNYDYVIC